MSGVTETEMKGNADRVERLALFCSNMMRPQVWRRPAARGLVAGLTTFRRKTFSVMETSTVIPELHRFFTAT
jgi:hypothetical protein